VVRSTIYIVGFVASQSQGIVVEIPVRTSMTVVKTFSHFSLMVSYLIPLDEKVSQFY